MTKPAIIVALDGMEVNEALYTASILKNKVWGFKINDLLLEAGTSIISKLRQHGYVFCDVKLHDIPKTVENSVKKLARAGANVISVHAAHDVKMLIAAVSCRGPSKIVGISRLTSREKKLDNIIFKAAFQILISHADGIVLGAEDIKKINRHHEFQKMVKIVPGIRPLWWSDKNDDQKRIATPREAAKAGADFLVVGRPITKSDNPAEAVERIRYEIMNTQE